MILEVVLCSWCGRPASETILGVNGQDVAACPDHLLDLGAVLAGEIKAPTRTGGA